MIEELKSLRASQAKLMKAAKTPSHTRDNSPAAQAVRPKVNIPRQSRPRSRDRATRTNTQISFRRSRRQTSSSDNERDSRGFLRRNRMSSPRGGVRRDPNLDRIGDIPNSRNRNTNQGPNTYLSGQAQNQFPTFAGAQNFSHPQTSLGQSHNNNGDQNYGAQGINRT